MADTICASATPLGTGGVSIIRISGDNAKQVFDKCFVPLNKEKVQPRVLYFGKIQFEDFCDDALCVYFKSPNSFTGEDVVEINLHGGYYLTKEVLERILKFDGIRMAEPGEFSKRAVVNGKMDITKAEGIIDIINAGSLSEIKASSHQIVGELKNKVNTIQNELKDLICEVDVAIDYPDQDIDYITNEELKNKILPITEKIKDLLKTAQTGAQVKNGVNIALVGIPNAGKSSLLNALLGYDRAIVTEIAGTTRDTLNESFEYGGIKFNIIDTAGVHNTDDKIEKMGIERSLKSAKDADMVLHLIDPTQPIEKQKIEFDNKNVLTIANKSDVKKINNLHIDLEISAKNKSNINELKELIFNKTIDKTILSSDVIITNIRHVKLLEQSLKELNEVVSATNATTIDCVALLLKDAWINLGKITGEYTDEAILDRIFAKFCLGK